LILKITLTYRSCLKEEKDILLSIDLFYVCVCIQFRYYLSKKKRERFCPKKMMRHFNVWREF